MKFYTNIRQRGDNLLYIGYENGERVQERIAYQPSILIPSTHPSRVAARDFMGNPLEEVSYTTIKECRTDLERLPEVYGTTKFPVAFISETYPHEIEYDMAHIRRFNLDIECRSSKGFPEPTKADEMITLVTLRDSHTGLYHVFHHEGRYEKHRDDVIQHPASSEADLLSQVATYWRDHTPDIVTGWNVASFDIMYLLTRVKKICGETFFRMFSPWGVINKVQSTVRRGQRKITVELYDIMGVSVLDYMELYMKYVPAARESYKLDYIGKLEVGLGKIEYEGTLDELYDRDPQLYTEYNVRDVEVVQKIDEKLKFLDLIVGVSYVGKVPEYTDSLGTVKYWETLIYHHLREKGQYYSASKTSSTKTEKYAGAFVKDPLVGMHKYIVSFDLTSLYPSIIRALNIGPDTIVATPQEILNLFKGMDSSMVEATLIGKSVDLSPLKGMDLAMSCNLKCYRRDKQSFLSELMEKVFNERVRFKKMMLQSRKEYEESGDDKHSKLATIYDVKQQAMKILINSAYGALGNQYFALYSLDNAEAITMTGRVVIQWMQRRLNEYLCKLLKVEKDFVIAADTDSLYVDFELLMSSVGDVADPVGYLDKICKSKIEPFIKKRYEELADYLNVRENQFAMKRESIATAGVFAKKKHYFMMVHDNEGVRYHEPKMKVMGIAVVKASTPEWCRDRLKECLKIILTGSEMKLQQYVRKCKKEFMSLSPRDIAFPRSVTDIGKWLDEDGESVGGIPIHVRAANNYNVQIDTYGLKLPKIEDASKVRFVYIKKPNPIFSHVIGFENDLPTEFGLDGYIDKTRQFDVAFLSTIRSICTLIGWEVESTATFASFG